MNGRIDELGIYNRALSPAELQALWQAGAAGKCLPVLPVLNLQPAATGVTVSWPTNAPGFRLQSAPRVAPALWSNAPSGPTNPVLLTSPATVQFYRLIKP